MPIKTWWTRGRKAVASITAIAVAVGVPLSLAVLHRGFPITDVDVTTRTVWVTNGDDILAGRLNRQIEELDAAVAAATPALDVVQNGNAVFLFDTTAGSLERIDPAFTRLTERVDLPSEAEIKLGGTTLAILDQSDGHLWIVDIANTLDFDPVDEPVLELGSGAHVAVSPDGTVFASSPSDGIVYTVAGLGAKPVETAVEFSDDHEIAAIGEQFAVLDRDANSLVRGDGSSIDLGNATGLKLQQSGAENDVAIVATGNSLLRVPLGGGSVEVGESSIPSPLTDLDSVSSPVWLEGCAHGAWSGAQQYVLWCDGAKPDIQPIEQPTKGSTLEFRVNKSVIALNNLDNGNVWLVDNEMRLVENWDEVTPPLEEETEEGDEKSSVQSFEDTLAERTEINRPPVAKEDQFGVRAGRTTVLPVLENDSDPDGDVLTIENTGEVDPAKGTLDLIDGGRALQFTPAAGSTNASFSYRINDGRGAAADSFVNISVVPAEENNPPIEKRTTSVGLEVGGTIDRNVLSDWVDPDGDDLTLTGASPVSGDEVRFTPDGFITFQSKTAELGEKEVRLTVSDGLSETTGTFIVDIAAPGSLTPIGTPDYAEVFVNEDVTIEPLGNDLTLSTAQLALVGIDDVPTSLTVDVNLDKNTLTISATEAGTYYFLYSLSAGPATSIGIVRVDVKPSPEGQLPPIAVKDTAYLRAGEPTLVKVLNNDVSPNGLVLAVQSVDTTSTNASLTVEILNNTTARITSSAALTEQTQFTYTISDGALTALAGVTVVPVAPIVNRQPPVAVPDRVKVRAEDYVSLDVLGNDYHPDDSAIVLEPELADDSGAGTGALAFINDQKLRYQAPKDPGEYSVTYRISDQFGESATATATFSVIARDLESNQPPAPQTQFARVYSGATVPITIPLDGVDPDGDSVVVTGISQQPTKGVIIEQTPNSFTYQANEGDAGTDEFRYLVEDTYGEKAIGVIYLGVIPRGVTNDPPNAVDDSVEIQPGRTASVQVLANDSDPAGYPLSISTELPEIDEGIEAEVSDEQVVITAPKTEGSFTIRYGIDNGRGGVDTAFIYVKVTKDAEPSYPVAIDYYVPIDDVVTNEVVTVDLEPLIANPGGRREDLVITVDGPNSEFATVDQDAQTIEVTAGDLRTAIAYTVTNELDELSTTAFIIVPPKVSANYAPDPYLDPKLGEQLVEMNGTKSWELEDIIIVPSGRKAIITDVSTVSATNSDGSSPYVDNDTITFSPGLDFRGVAGITFEVTDGKNKDDLNGNTAIITLPVTVGNPDFTDAPPQFTAQNVTIEAGEDPLVVDLRASTTHQNPALIPQFTYTGLTGTTSAVSASISGGDLSITIPRGSPVGTKTVLSFTVNYREFKIPGTVTVTSVPSTKAHPQAVQDEDKGRRGVAQPAFDVLANDYNPFASTNEPLRVLDAYIETAGTGASVDFDADGTVQVTPDASFIGAISVVYTIGDATKEPSREVQGRYILTVRDAPSKIEPGPVATPGDLQATVTWTTPATNGEPITGYTVTWSPPHGSGGGSVSLPGSAASYTATGLTNGQDYTFRVTATNIMGTSTLSDQSNAARPLGQASPATMGAVTPSTNGSGNVTFAWAGAGANGGNITGYQVTVYQGATQVYQGDVPSSPYTFTGTVGQAYTASVVARATGGDSNPSARSSAGSPTPGAPAVNLTAPGAAGNYTLNGSWSAPAANGVSASAITYSWSISPNPGNGSGAGANNVPSPQSLSWTGTASRGYTLSVTATVNGVSGPAGSDGATTPGAPPPPGYSANAAVGTCPEKQNGAGTTGNFSPGPPASCSSDHGFVNGNITVYCGRTMNGSTWYEFSGDGYSRGPWHVKGSTITISGSPPGC